jgi:hypothetical protein
MTQNPKGQLKITAEGLREALNKVIIIYISVLHKTQKYDIIR